MALQADPPYLGDIGDERPDAEPDPDRVYERTVEKRAADERDTGGGQ